MLKKVLALIWITLIIQPAAAQLEPSLIWTKDLQSSISAVDLSGDGRLIGVGHFDGNIEIFNSKASLLWTYKSNQPIRSVSLDYKGQFIFIGSGSEVLLFKNGDLRWRRTLGLIKDAAISEDGKRLSAVTKSKIYFLDQSGNIVETWKTKGAVESISLSGDGYALGLGDNEGVSLFEGGELNWSYPVNRISGDEGETLAPSDIVYDLETLGEHVGAVTKRGNLFLFDRKGRTQWFFPLGVPSYSLSITSDGGLALVGTSEGAQLITQEGLIWKGSDRLINGVGLSNDGEKLVIATEKRLEFYSLSKDVPLSVVTKSPVKGSTVSGEVEFEFTAAGASKTAFFLDGTFLSSKSGYRLDTNLINNGWHEVTAQVWDNNGSVKNDTLLFLVDNGAGNPPSIRIVEPGDGEIVSRVARIFSLTNLLYDEVTIAIDGTKVASGLLMDWDTRSYSEGAHKITIRAERLGVVYEDSVIVFVDNRLDKVSPSVNILYPFPQESISGTIGVRAYFSQSPKETFVFVDGNLLSDSLPFIWDTKDLTYGDHEIAVYAVDEVGNIGFDKSMVNMPEPKDPDGDGWSSEKESLFRTDPSDPDTDGDGILDSVDEDPKRDYESIYNYFYALIVLLFLGALFIREIDLKLLVSTTLLADVFSAIAPFDATLLRLPLGIFLVFFASGYGFISAMFPKKDITNIERFTLSVAFSIVIFVFNGFMLNFTWGFRRLPIVLSLSMIILFFAAAASFARERIPKENRYTIDLKLPKISKTPLDGIEKALLIAMVISIALSTVMLVYALTAFKHEEFTVLYVLDENGRVDNYPKGFFIGETQTLKVGVENYERHPEEYRLEVRLNDALLKAETLSLKDKEKLVKDVEIEPSQVGEMSKLEFQLYKKGDFEPYRDVHLWVSSRPNLADPSSYFAYELEEPPVVENWDFEIKGLSWRYLTLNRNYRGFYDNETFVSPPFSYQIALSSGDLVSEGEYGEIFQQIVADSEGFSILSFKTLDSYRSSSSGKYSKQVLLNGKIIWEQDLARSRGWEQYAVPIMLRQGTNTIRLRLTRNGGTRFPISIWWDEVEFQKSDSLQVL